MKYFKQRERNNKVFDLLTNHKKNIANDLALIEFEKSVKYRNTPARILDKAIFNI